MSKIISIDADASWSRAEWHTYDGVSITLDDGRFVRFGISNGQDCCESWGYLHPADDYTAYIGAEYIGIREIDTWPANIPNPNDRYGFDDGGFQAVEISTSNGQLQFVVYNAHNGYYSHATVVIEGDSVIEGSL